MFERRGRGQNWQDICERNTLRGITSRLFSLKGKRMNEISKIYLAFVPLNEIPLNLNAARNNDGI